MTPVEEKLMQVKMKSSEGNLRYPNMLNEQYASFNDLIQSFDQAPTAQQLEVYDELHTRLTAQLAKWQQIQTADVPALNEPDAQERHAGFDRGERPGGVSASGLWITATWLPPVL